MKDRRTCYWITAFCLAMLTACGGQAPPSVAADDPGLPKPDSTIVDLLFTYGSEKEKWLKEVTAAFNKSGVKVGDKTIRVTRHPHQQRRVH